VLSRLPETPGSVRLPAPEFGQHTEVILTEVLGYSWEQVAELKDREVV
jgi:crotonobetainyl-CoA:carnitine CoA-transferase CaiB-like acyl-CoA transferase